jgi:hypothetical protein
MTSARRLPPSRGPSGVTPHSRCRPENLQRQRRLLASRLTKAAAEEVLDWLQAHGRQGCQVSYVAGEGFTITE